MHLQTYRLRFFLKILQLVLSNKNDILLKLLNKNDRFVLQATDNRAMVLRAKLTQESLKILPIAVLEILISQLFHSSIKQTTIQIGH